MRITRLALCAFAGLAGTAYGAQSIENFTQIEETQVYDVRTGQWMSQSTLTDRSAATIYSNVSTPTASGIQQSIANQVVADDVNPANLNQFTGGNATVSEVTISIANFGQSIANQALSLDIIFYANDATGVGGVPIAGTEIGRASINVGSFSLNGSSFGLFAFSGLESIMSPVVVGASTFWTGVQFNSIGGGAATQLGQVFYANGSVGSSDNTKYFNSATTNPAFTASSTNNVGLQIVGVPAPGAIALFGLGGLIAGRRRRR